MLFFVGFIFILSFSSYASSCPEPQITDYSSTYYYCTAEGKVREQKIFFNKNQMLQSYKKFDFRERLILNEIYNSAGEMTEEIRYIYVSNHIYIEKSYTIVNGQRRFKSHKEFISRGEDSIVKEWIMHKVRGKGLNYKNIYRNGNLISRLIYADEKCVEKLDFTYQKTEGPLFGYLESFKAYDCQNKAFLYSYNVDSDLDPELALNKAGLSESDLFSKKQILNNNERRKVLIIDSGFELKHPDLVYKFLKNKDEILDGFDNDGNGIVDDITGIYYDNYRGFQANINERVKLLADTGIPFPFSHGTHVASLALKGIDAFALYPVAGDFTSSHLLSKAAAYLGQNKVGFVNMSFSFGHNFKSVLDPMAFSALRGMIASSKETLFAVAAGNDSKNLDQSYHSKSFPASYTYENILVVGALDTPGFREEEAFSYRPAFFSNVGLRTVDVFAPGDRVEGAALGGQRIRVSGTSMATPNALNSALKIAEAFPSLDSITIKDILLFSAYIPNLEEPLPCKSGGMVYLRRAFKTARIVMEQNINVQEAALKARKDPLLLLRGERLDEDYFSALKKLWLERAL